MAPVQPRLEGGAFDGAGAPRLDEAAEKIALAAAVHGDIHRQAEGAEAVVARTPHPIVDPGIVAAHIELEDARRLRRRGGLLEPRLADGGEHLRHAELRRASRRRGGAALDDRLEAANRRQHHRQPYLSSEKSGGAVDPAY